MRKSLFVAVSALAILLAVQTVPAATTTTSKMQIYAVTNVVSGGLLNMRSAPSTTSKVVIKLPANADGIVATGEEKKVGQAVWVKVYWKGTGGWINKYYLRPESTTTTKPSTPTSTPAKPTPRSVVMKCNGTEPFWGIDITEASLNVNMADGPQYRVPVTFRQTSANNRTIAVIAGADGPNATQVFLQKVNSCSDGMSDTVYPYTATAVLNNQRVISGCCKVQ